MSQKVLVRKKKSPGGESNTRSQDYNSITVSRLSQLGHREDSILCTFLILYKKIEC